MFDASKLAATLLLVASLSYAEPTDYARDVKPVLRERCYACHGALKQEAGMRLDTVALMLQGGDSGAVLRPGKPQSSLLLERVGTEDASLRMPPEGAPLSPEQIAHLSAWIAAGAIAPDHELPSADPREHWAFRPPVKQPIPGAVPSDWARNPIDAFIAADHNKHGLEPLPPASREMLLRRVTFDLIGLPPTRRDLHVFLADTRDDAYERVVDRLLASPQYGERWGRHWMDVWRYSDWYGRRKVPDVLNSYGQIWRWRDWIFRSLNEDKGYDQMVMQMLAADELAPEDDENLVATGFLVRNFYRWNYNTWMKDNVEHTGKAFLGLTLNCCHCHDHKYDPLSHEEYFRFRAFFEPIEIRHDRVPGEPDPGPYPKYSYGASYKPIASGMVRICDERLDAETFMYSGGESRNVIPGEPAVQPGVPAILGGEQVAIKPIELPASAWYPGLKAFVQREEVGKRQSELAAAEEVLRQAVVELEATESRFAQVQSAAGDGTASETQLVIARLNEQVDQANVRRAQAELAAINARVHADSVLYLGQQGDAEASAREAYRAERRAAVETAQLAVFQAERDTALARSKAADDKKAQAEVTKAEQRIAAARAALKEAESRQDDESTEYTPLSPRYAKTSTGRRAALAKWLASKQNPLTARVAMNHMWLRHFGHGLVETAENFGRNGAEPSHPALLDWLAVELMDHDWSMKHVHRLIVTSRTYQLASSTGGTTAHPSQLADPNNRYLWRFDASRVQAEVLRDSMLFASGELDLAIGGKEIDQSLGLTSPRRSVYFEHHGEGRMPFLDLFDAANPCDCYERASSVRPQQALAMANSELSSRCGESLAHRLASECRDDEAGFVTAAFELVLSRPPSPEELLASQKFLHKQRELLEQSAKQGIADTVMRSRASFAQALFSHHDFVTIR